MALTVLLSIIAYKREKASVITIECCIRMKVNAYKVIDLSRFLTTYEWEIGRQIKSIKADNTV